MDYWIYIDIIVYTVVPFVVMSVCSFFILNAVRKTNKSYMGKLVSTMSRDARRVNIYKRSKKERQILYMLLITILYFFLSQMPFCIAFILFHGQKSDSMLGQWLVHILSYSNNAINFVFYGLSSQRFRHELISIFLSQSALATRHHGRCDAATQADGNGERNYINSSRQVHTPKSIVQVTLNDIETEKTAQNGNALNLGILKNHHSSQILSDIESLNSKEDVPLDGPV